MKFLKDFFYFFVIANGASVGWHFGLWAVIQPEFFSFYLPITCALLVPVIFALKNKLTELMK